MTVSSVEHARQKTYEWLREFQNSGKLKNEEQAYSVLRAVLHAIRDRIPVNTSVHLASQLPMLLAGVYFNGWDPSKLVRGENLEDFITSIQEYERGLDINAKNSIESVITFLSAKIDTSILEEINAVLPDKLKVIFQHEFKKAA